MSEKLVQVLVLGASYERIADSPWTLERLGRIDLPGSRLQRLRLGLVMR